MEELVSPRASSYLASMRQYDVAIIRAVALITRLHSHRRACNGGRYHGSCLDIRRTDQMKIVAVAGYIALLVGATFLGSALMDKNWARAVVGTCILISGAVILARRRPSPR